MAETTINCPRRFIYLLRIVQLLDPVKNLKTASQIFANDNTMSGRLLTTEVN
jgi:hypothetical protein